MTTLSAPERVLPARETVRPLRARGTDSLPLLGAVVLHLMVIGALLLRVVEPLMELPEPPALETEVISARDFDALHPSAPASPLATSAAPAEASLPATVPAAPAARPAPAVAPDDTVRPTRMLSGDALASPKNRRLRQQMATLADEERIAQLCDFEAMEQIHAWQHRFQPDRLVDYALSDPHWENGVFVAAGSAFRAGADWFELSYRCTLDATRRTVTGFAFRVGPSIPRTEWTALNLPAVH
ncbi:DUF930 domain-containing protein [Ancylobacter sp. SL191]|uniref:DUF930 domain-containing protein n=1 Tax=Ancylobacter sp. SL191 TaxID=2995166 RepID=UPI00227044CC|nr:DUF930 domain-containing protein [Ancylobacter sp. SL191]WAC25869.1 DUF930 domain-containing protein [Ancylobacter sp. SL191]